MTGYPNSPSISKAALITTGPMQPVPGMIVLQYNPDELSRSLQPDTEQIGDGPTGTGMIAGPPRETITLTARISAFDQLQGNDPTAIAFGIHPQLAALELMLFPGSAAIAAELAQLALGVLELVPPEPPLAIFVWGPSRVLPVQITSYSVTEVMHDTLLNPIDATVQLGLQVLTYRDFTPDQLGFSIYLANLAQREAMSAMAGIQSGGSLIRSVLNSL